MAVEFISGKPGGGKSLRTMMLIEQELRTSQRNITTNISLKLPELAEYLHNKYGETFDAHMRIRVLTPEETMCFWLFPSPGQNLDPFAKVRWEAPTGRKMEVPDMRAREAKGSVGTLFAIDEAHIAFSARNWQANGSDGFFYLSQHRKYHDDVLLITQFVENVDKQFRSVAQSYTYVRNRSMESLPLLGGLIRNVGGMTQTEYTEPFRTGMISQNTKFFQIDKEGIAKCYDTMAGFGVAGRGGPESKKRKGLPFWTLFIPVVVIVAVLWYAPRLLGRAVGVATKEGSAAVAVKGYSGGKGVVTTKEVESREAVIVKEIDEIWLTGTARLPGGVQVFMFSDGSQINDRDPDYEGGVKDGAGRICGLRRGGKNYSLRSKQPIGADGAESTWGKKAL